MSRRVNILMPEEIPSQNKGEGAILNGLLETLAVFGEFNLTLVTRFERDAKEYSSDRCRVLVSKFTARSIPRQALNAALLAILCLIGLIPALGRFLARFLGKVPAAFLQADIILIGHDNCFAAVGPRMILTYFPIVLLARLLGKKIACLSASIGPFDRESDIMPQPRLSRMLGRDEFDLLARVRPNPKGFKDKLSRLKKRLVLELFRLLVLNRVDLITTRESYSARLLESLSVTRPKLAVTTDLAFLLEPAPKEEIDSILSGLGLAEETRLAGITACRWLAAPMLGPADRPLSTLDEKIRAYCELMARTADLLSQEFGLSVLLLPHVLGPEPYQDDRPLNRKILSLADPDSKIVLVEQELSPAQLKGIIGRLDILVGSRTHSLIAAGSQGVPLIGLTDQNRFKTNGIIGEQLGQADRLLMVERLEFDQLAQAARETWENKKSIRTKLLAKTPALIETARQNGQLLSTLMIF